jgi:hypothetical protein
VVELGVSAKQRAKSLLVVIAFPLCGAAALWLSLSGLVPSIRAVVSHAPVVELDPRDAISLPLALTFFAFAAMTLLPAPQIGRSHARRKGNKPGQSEQKWLMIWLGVAMAGVLLAVMAVPITEVAAMEIMSKQHYVACPASPFIRHAKMRWALPKAHCP